MIDWEKIWNIDAWQVKTEFIGFLQLLYMSNVKSVLEIGTHKGGSARAFLEMGMDVTSIDIVKQNEVHGVEKEYPESFEFLYRTEPIKLDHRGYDLLFIDGDHSYEAVKEDYDRFAFYINPGGFIAFHDAKPSRLHRIQENGAPRFWNEIKTEPFIEFFDPAEEWGGIGVMRKI